MRAKFVTPSFQRHGFASNSGLGICICHFFAVQKVCSNAHFKVVHKFRGKRTLKELKAHDDRRHGRVLSAVDVALGGTWRPADAGLYYTRIRLGNPPRDYHVQLDTGSQILWVNGASCVKCPRESGLGFKLNFYDANSSSTAKLVSCGEKNCRMMYQFSLFSCNPRMLCEYQISYGDGSLTSGYFVEDTIHFDKAFGNQQTKTANGSVVFGYAANQNGELTQTDAAVDGILGFGQGNSSVLSQLANAGKVKKMFSHCLDGGKGGGIFSIGQVVEPKLTTTAPLIPHRPHYYIFMTSVEVAGDVIKLSTPTSREGKEALVDSGTTLVHLPRDIYEPMTEKILSRQRNLQIHIMQEQFSCFHYDGNLDDGFPTVILHFQNSLNLTVYPHDYLFSSGDNDGTWCLGWMKGKLSRFAVLGDFLFTNKLVFYDVENQTVGWTDYNCSSSIKVKDKESGEVYAIGAHDISPTNSSSSSNSSHGDSIPRRILTRR